MKTRLRQTIAILGLLGLLTACAGPSTPTAADSAAPQPAGGAVADSERAYHAALADGLGMLAETFGQTTKASADEKQTRAILWQASPQLRVERRIVVEDFITLRDTVTVQYPIDDGPSPTIGRLVVTDFVLEALPAHAATALPDALASAGIEVTSRQRTPDGIAEVTLAYNAPKTDQSMQALGTGAAE